MVSTSAVYYKQNKTKRAGLATDLILTLCEEWQMRAVPGSV
jgi:hypothetical protein